MKSARFTSSAAFSTSASVIPLVPRRMLPSTVPVNRNGSCSTTPISPAKFGKIHLFYVDAIDFDCAFLHIIEAHEQRDDRGLAGARVADDSDSFTGFDGEGHIAQNPVRLGGSISRALLGLDGSNRPHMAIASLGLCGRGRLARVSALHRHVAVSEPNMIKLNPPRPVGVLVTAGEVISAGVSSNLKTRSLAAMADCRMLYFSLKS